MPRKDINPEGSDYGTPESRRRAFWVVEQPDDRDRSTRRIRIETQDMVDWYLKRAYLTQVQADALHKWQADAYLSGLMPSCIGGYQQGVTGGVSELSDLRLAAQSRRANAIKFVAKMGHNAVQLVDAVAVNGKSAGRWWLENIGGPANDALVMLDKLANGLSRHYGLAK